MFVLNSYCSEIYLLTYFIKLITRAFVLHKNYKKTVNLQKGAIYEANSKVPHFS